MSNIFDDMEKEDLSDDNSGVFFEPGEYPLLRVLKCEHVEESDMSGTQRDRLGRLRRLTSAVAALGASVGQPAGDQARTVLVPQPARGSSDPTRSGRAYRGRSSVRDSRTR